MSHWNPYVIQFLKLLTNCCSINERRIDVYPENLLGALPPSFYSSRPFITFWYVCTDLCYFPFFIYASRHLRMWNLGSEWEQTSYAHRPICSYYKGIRTIHSCNRRTGHRSRWLLSFSETSMPLDLFAPDLTLVGPAPRVNRGDRLFIALFLSWQPLSVIGRWRFWIIWNNSALHGWVNNRLL